MSIKMDHYYLIPHIDRQEIMNTQVTLSYRTYCWWFLKELKVSKKNIVSKSNKKAKQIKKAIKHFKKEKLNFKCIDENYS